MLSAIVAFFGGAVVTACIGLLRTYFSNKENIAKLEASNKANLDRISDMEKQAQADRFKRMKDIIDEATKINDSGSAADALKQLRKQFPNTSNS